MIIPIINLSRIFAITAVHYHKRMTTYKEIRFLLSLSVYQHYGRNVCAMHTTAAKYRISIPPIAIHFINRSLKLMNDSPLGIASRRMTDILIKVIPW